VRWPVFLLSVYLFPGFFFLALVSLLFLAFYFFIMLTPYRQRLIHGTMSFAIKFLLWMFDLTISINSLIFLTLLVRLGHEFNLGSLFAAPASTLLHLTGSDIDFFFSQNSQIGIFESSLLLASGIGLAVWARAIRFIAIYIRILKIDGFSRVSALIREKFSILQSMVVDICKWMLEDPMEVAKNIGIFILILAVAFGFIGGSIALVVYFDLGRIFGYVMLIAIMAIAAGPVYSIVRELKSVRQLPVAKLEMRRSIEDAFVSLRSSYSRSQLVHRIEQHHRKNGSRPEGQWSRGIAPNLNDKASIRLSQLEENWVGLER
jgi:hypothetical protein